MHRDESTIIQRALDGRESAFAELYNRYKNAFFSVCLRYASHREEAEDYLQDGFSKIFRELHQYDSSKGKFYTWATRVIINCILEGKRKKRILVSESELIEYESRFKVDAEVLSQLDLKDVIKALQKLPDGYRTVFNLYFFEDLNHKEVAEKLGISESTSKTQLMKAKQIIREKLSDHLILSNA